MTRRGRIGCSNHDESHAVGCTRIICGSPVGGDLDAAVAAARLPPDAAKRAIEHHHQARDGPKREAPGLSLHRDSCVSDGLSVTTASCRRDSPLVLLFVTYL